MWLDLSPLSKILCTCRNPKTRKDPNPLVSSISDIQLILRSQLLNSVYIFRVHTDLCLLFYLMFHWNKILRQEVKRLKWPGGLPKDGSWADLGWVPEGPTAPSAHLQTSPHLDCGFLALIPGETTDRSSIQTLEMAKFPKPPLFW